MNWCSNHYNRDSRGTWHCTVPVKDIFYRFITSLCEIDSNSNRNHYDVVLLALRNSPSNLDHGVHWVQCHDIVSTSSYSLSNLFTWHCSYLSFPLFSLDRKQGEVVTNSSDWLELIIYIRQKFHTVGHCSEVSEFGELLGCLQCSKDTDGRHKNIRRLCRTFSQIEANTKTVRKLLCYPFIAKVSLHYLLLEYR